jgi:NADP-dependent 3-hydroxy acid dehydrogenase YdfG
MLEVPAPSYGSSFHGLHVLLSGGTTGIGRATALQLVRHGASVFIFGRHDAELRDALEDGKGGPGSLHGTTADQADPAQVKEVFDEVDRVFPHLDVLINNAAVGGDDLLEQNDSDVAYVVAANLCGYLYCTRHAVARMKARKSGHIINIGSIVTEKLSAGGEIYTATKAANHALSESARKSLQECGIKVTLIEPGRTGSDLLDQSPEEQRRCEAVLEMMKAEDVADAVCYCLTQSRRAVITSLQIEPFRHQ